MKTQRLMELAGIKKSNILLEYKKIDGPELDALCKKIARLTDNNYHSKSIIELAKFLKNTKYQKIMEFIEKIHDLEGSLPDELSTYRSSILEYLIKKVETVYGKDIADKINNNF